MQLIFFPACASRARNKSASPIPSIPPSPTCRKSLRPMPLHLVLIKLIRRRSDVTVGQGIQIVQDMQPATRMFVCRKPRAGQCVAGQLCCRRERPQA